jgi:methylase of polypeptide subunit release factors
MTFDRLEIAYDDRVLRPRAWTAQQSRWAAELIGTAPAGRVLELCAGAGQIGLLAVALAPRPLVCVDLSPVACYYARRNARAAGLGDLVEVRQGRLEEVLDPAERFAVVMADPPWVPSEDTDRFPEDPLVAIDGGRDGLDAARACLRVAERHLLPGGDVILQVGTRAQVERLAGEIDALVVREVRDGERGVLVRLGRVS